MAKYITKNKYCLYFPIKTCIPEFKRNVYLTKTFLLISKKDVLKKITHSFINIQAMLRLLRIII